MSSENVPLVGYKVDHSFYTGQEISTGNVGAGGISRRLLHGLTIISVLIACGCSIYGAFQAKNALIMLPFLITLVWLFIHFVLLYFEKQEKHDFHPPGWFIFVSSGHVVIQSLVVMILTLVKN